MVQGEDMRHGKISTCFGTSKAPSRLGEQRGNSIHSFSDKKEYNEDLKSLMSDLRKRTRAEYKYLRNKSTSNR